MDKFVEIKMGFNKSLHTKSFSKQSFYLFIEIMDNSLYFWIRKLEFGKLKTL